MLYRHPEPASISLTELERTYLLANTRGKMLLYSKCRLCIVKTNRKALVQSVIVLVGRYLAQCLCQCHACCGTVSQMVLIKEMEEYVCSWRQVQKLFSCNRKPSSLQSNAQYHDHTSKPKLQRSILNRKPEGITTHPPPKDIESERTERKQVKRKAFQSIMER
jgi:hypothetical protein